jgi:DNA-binding transcriptional ArsR family regulator
VDPQGNGLILMPSAFWNGRPLITWDPLAPAQHVLIYPAVPDGREPGGRSSELADALGALLGPTRATVLTTLRRPQTTSGLARELGLSTSTVSDHTATLREAGLITSRREGQKVEHRLTRLGHALITQPR